MSRKYIPRIAALMTGAALFLTGCGITSAKNEPEETDEPSVPVSEAPTETPVLPDPVAPGFAEGDDMPVVTHIPVTPIPTDDPEQEPSPAVEPDSGVDVPEQDVPADDEYFADAAFIGNSLMDGFRLYSGLTCCDIYAKTSMTVLGVGDYLNQMADKEYGKIYILLGINEIGYESYTFKDYYTDMVERLQTDHPDAVIYIMGLSPVSRAKSDSHDYFNMERIGIYNERLHEIAEEKGCRYIDLCDALAGEDGYLPADVTFDGIHFTAEEYGVWLDYLRTHYIPDETEDNAP